MTCHFNVAFCFHIDFVPIAAIQEHRVVEFVLVTLMRALGSTREVFEVPAPHALGALLVVGGLTKAGFPGLAVAAMLVTDLLYAATRQIIVFIASSETDGR